MIEVFAILYFSQVVGDNAKEKGYSKKWVVFYFIIFWLFGEITGAIIGHVLSEGFVVYLFAIVGAVFGGLILFGIVNMLSPKSNSRLLTSTDKE